MVLDKAPMQFPRVKINTSSDVYPVLQKIHAVEGSELYESFYLLYLNRANVTVGYSIISRGGITGTTADVRLIIQAALGCAAVYILACHNHPSGGLRPSKADEYLTQKVKEAAKLHDITLMDHMIISDQGYFSFMDEGLL